MRIGHTFLLSASTLMSGTIIAQAIVFAASFVLTRLYSPEQYGHYSVVIAIAGVAGAVSTGALDRAIILARSNSTARRVATLTFFTAVSFAAVFGVLGGFSIKVGGFATTAVTAIDLVLLVPVFIVSYAGSQIFTLGSLRDQRPTRIAVAKIVQSLLMVALQISMVSLAWAPGLLVGHVAAWTVFLLAGAWWRLRQGALLADLRLRSMQLTFWRFRRFPRYIMPNEAVDALSNHAPLFIVGIAVSLSQAGHYGLALMMLSAPAAIMGQAVANSFLQYVGGGNSDLRAIEAMMWRIWGGMAAIGIPVFGLLSLFGPTIFAIAFGDEWGRAGEIARYLAVLIFFRFVSAPTSSIFMKLEKQHIQWRFAIAAGVYRPGIYSLCFLGSSFEIILLLHVVIEGFAIVLYNGVALRTLRRQAIGVSRT